MPIKHDIMCLETLVYNYTKHQNSKAFTSSKNLDLDLTYLKSYR